LTDSVARATIERVLRDAAERLRVWFRRVAGRRRGLRAAARRFRRLVAGAGAVGLVALAVLLAVAGVPEPISGVGDIFANLGRNLLTAAVLGAIAWLWLYSWTSARATRRLREDARERPEKFFPIPPQAGSAARVVGRDHVVADIAANLRSDARTGPQVVVGETGSGKTSVLLKLAAHFAEGDVLPIILSLRDVEEDDLAKLAKERFCEYVDPHLRTAEEADKLWRWMCKKDKIVVLVDDLDRASFPGQTSDPYRRDLPMVVASRHEGVPPDLPEPPIELGPLEWDDSEGDVGRAVDTVLARAGRRNDSEARERVARMVEAGNVLSNVFYIDVITSLLCARQLPEPPAAGEHAVRIALLNAWRDSVLGDRTVPAAVIERRKALLAGLEEFAVDRLVPPAYRNNSSKGAAAADPSRWTDALHFGEETGIVEIEDDGSYRFAHDVLHAYFAAARLPSDECAWRRALAAAADAPRVQLALVLAAASSRDADFCKAVCDALLAGGDSVPDERRLLRAAAAAEIARAGRWTGLDDRVAAECMAARGEASRVAKTAALSQLADLTGERALHALWDYAGDADYGVRWRAVEQLLARFPADGDSARRRPGVKTGREAYDVLAGEIGARLEAARRSLAAGRQPDDWDPEIAPLKHIGWMLPALRSRALIAGDKALSELVEAHLDELLRLEEEKVTPQKGLEASIAQGFKVDARLHRGAGIDRRLRTLLERDDAFWYSQLNLVHAVALAAPKRDDAIKELDRFTTKKRHPYVRAAARLCKKGLARRPADILRYVCTKGLAGRRADILRYVCKKGLAPRPDYILKYVWDDEGVVVSGRPPGGLAGATSQLVGEIVVLLNLNETGGPAQREEFGRRNDLPRCMGASKTRVELFDERVGCPEACKFKLCPYRPAVSSLSAHREISRSFCRHQRFNATKSNARKWDSKVNGPRLRELWRRMELLARE
jgi:hypothetical protein